MAEAGSTDDRWSGHVHFCSRKLEERGRRKVRPGEGKNYKKTGTSEKSQQEGPQEEEVCNVNTRASGFCPSFVPGKVTFLALERKGKVLAGLTS